MKFAIIIIATVLSVTFAPAANEKKPTTQRNPHPVDLTYYLSDVHDAKDVDAIVASLKKVKSVSKAEINTEVGFVQVGFESHAVSYHQIAQAIANAGAATG